jgi:hypothetical protein
MRHVCPSADQEVDDLDCGLIVAADMDRYRRTCLSLASAAARRTFFSLSVRIATANFDHSGADVGG